ncbi:1-deoxy-D-xylulose-5-phosphate synthase [Haemophilus influenzae]|nr:1-deoxy-D-xylulose-5-phosphate synthase [Haemophilus influenzae]
MKGVMFSPESTLFEELGFNYIGPVDGHNIEELVATLTNMRNLKGPQFLHIKTKKGKGYAPAEKDPIGFHGVPKFDPISGELPKNNSKPTYSKIFGDWLCEMAEKDAKIIGITPAMREGSGMVEFSQRFPKQYFDVAIAEQHAVTFATGLAIGGYKPVVAIYSTFLQRAYDQLIHDVAIQNLPVLFAIDRAGIVGADGATHQGAFDLSFMRCIPNMIIMTPSDENECRQMLYTGYQCGKPAAVRYPRGNAVGVKLTPLEMLPIGKSRLIREGQKIAILNFGTLLPSALEASEKLNATVVDMRFVKPIDIEMINMLAQTHDYLVTLEENAIQGGVGSAVSEVLNSSGKSTALLQLGLPDYFIPQATQQEALEDLGLDTKGIEEKIINFIAKQDNL